MGSKISRRPVCTPKPKPAAPKQKAKAAEPKPAARHPQDTFEAAKPALTFQKIESIWKDGNLTGTDDWQKSNL